MGEIEAHALYQAIKENNIDEFRAIMVRCSITSGALLPDPVGVGEPSLLVHACRLARREMALSLLRIVSQNDIRNAFPIVIQSGNVDMVREFIEFGVNVNSSWSDDEGLVPYFTPLIGAVRLGNFELVKYLTEKQADVNPVDPHGEVFMLQTAVSYCNLRKDGELIKYLIWNGVNVNENKGETLFTIFDKFINTYDYRWEEIFDLCLEYGGKLERHPYMYFACKAGFRETVKYLIARGLSANDEVRYNGHIALHIASCNGKKESSIVDLLLKWGADPKTQVTAIGDDLYDTFLVGFSALHYACSQGDLEKLELLLDYGADVNCVNCSNVSVLFQLLDAVCKDKLLYEYMVFSSKRFETACTECEINEVKSKAEHQLERYTKMTKLLLASGAKLIEDEWLISYDKPYVVMSMDVLVGSSNFLLQTRSLIEYVKTRLKTPSSLTELCTRAIRTLLPARKSQSILKLEGILPQCLMTELLYEDIFI